ncbi:MAG TPA: macro domain-containing protein [Stellaceae bacterium]|nr:macro domain-containing protein [Stellaceae bacterium]
MIEYRTGDILQTDAEALVNTVNCVGIMGRGIALQFKNAFPANFKAYAAACRRGEVQPGRMFVFETGTITSPKYIINFPTKRHWRGKSRLEDIEAGLAALKWEIRDREIRSVAVPPLGSGLGGLHWPNVRESIEAALRGLNNVEIIVFEPSGAPDPQVMARSRTPPEMTPGRAALVGLMSRYLGGLMDPFVTLLEVHKLLYFMQEAGQPLRLRYVQALYGPYAENLSHVLRRIEGHLVSGYADGGDDPEKQLELVPGAVEEAKYFLRGHADTRFRFDRVADLVAGFETPFGLELLSTVHWVVRRLRATTPEDVVATTYAWGDRKRRFSTRQIGLALEVLSTKGWLAGT